MRKVNSLVKVLLIFIALIVSSSNICYADVYVSPTIDLIYFLPVVGIALIVALALLVISIVCIVVGKMTENENLVNKSRENRERFFYYSIIFFISTFTVFLLAEFFIVGLVPAAFVIFSLIFRLAIKNKANAYRVLVGLGVLIVSIYIIEYILIMFR